ncbi:UNVERIFIED_CONTAM: hypothetical protein FKN15_072070 [Acipenser sinensis]
MEPRTAFPPSLKIAEQKVPTDRHTRSLPQLQDGRDSGHVTKHMPRVPSNVTLRKSAGNFRGEELNSRLFSSIPRSRKTSLLVGRNFGTPVKLDCPLEGCPARNIARLDRHFHRMHDIQIVNPEYAALMSKAKATADRRSTSNVTDNSMPKEKHKSTEKTHTLSPDPGKSKEAEIKRINKELANIRSKFKGDKALDGYSKKKYVCKLLFIFLLGHDIDFGHMEAVNLLSSNKYTEKQIDNGREKTFKQVATPNIV